jgi:hypothetical protein
MSVEAKETAKTKVRFRHCIGFDIRGVPLHSAHRLTKSLCPSAPVPHTRAMTKSPRNVLPLTPMIAAVLVFAAFHFLPVQKDWDEPGWGIWPEVYDVLMDPVGLDPLDGIGLASFLMFSLLIVSSPFLIGVWRKSKLAWQLATIFSGLGAAGFWVMILGQGGAGDLVAGGWCLMVAPVLNLAGLLLVGIENSRAAQD